MRWQTKFISVIILTMFENSEPSKTKTTQHPLLIPFWPMNANTQLRGHIKQIGKYQFSFDRKLGSGLTSDAYIGIQKSTHKLVCVKIIDRQTFKNQTQKVLLSNEIKCQQKLKSDYIINIYDVYDTNSFCFVVTELCEDGDLFKLIQYSRLGLPEPLVIRFAYHLSQALIKMKQCKIIHRDIKSQNILLKNGVAKLGDFGFAIEEKDLKDKQQFNIGSPLYMALQTLEQNKYSYASDVFAFGIVIYEMLHGQSPWECFEQIELINRMKNQQIVYKNGINDRLKHIVNSCLRMEASQRAPIDQIAEQLKQLLKYQQESEKVEIGTANTATQIQSEQPKQASVA